MQRERFGKIVKADHSGDTAIAEFTPGVKNEQVEVAQEALTKFLTDCVNQHRSVPPVWARRIGEETYTPFHGDFLPARLRRNGKASDSLLDVETIVIQQPLVGG